MGLVEIIVNPLFGKDSIGNCISKVFCPAFWFDKADSFVNETVATELVLRVMGIQLISILS